MHSYLHQNNLTYSTFLSTCTVLSMVDDFRVRRLLRELRGRFLNPDGKVRKSFTEEEKDVGYYYYIKLQ